MANERVRHSGRTVRTFPNLFQKAHTTPLFILSRIRMRAYIHTYIYSTSPTSSLACRRSTRTTMSTPHNWSASCLFLRADAAGATEGVDVGAGAVYPTRALCFQGRCLTQHPSRFRARHRAEAAAAATTAAAVVAATATATRIPGRLRPPLLQTTAIVMMQLFLVRSALQLGFRLNRRRLQRLCQRRQKQRHFRVAVKRCTPRRTRNRSAAANAHDKTRPPMAACCVTR